MTSGFMFFPCQEKDNEYVPKLVRRGAREISAVAKAQGTPKKHQKTLGILRPYE